MAKQRISNLLRFLAALPEEEADSIDKTECLKKISIPEDDEQFEEVYRCCGYIANRCSQSFCNECPVNLMCRYYRNKRREEEKIADKPVFADFFCGAGGLSLGFTQAGFKISLANDIQRCCTDTYALNHPEAVSAHIICGNIDDILGHLNDFRTYDRTDVVIGGPPCQGFSMANRQRLIDDPRNSLYKSFIKAVNMLKPSFVVMENVRGILKYKEQIYEDYRNIGYHVTAHLLNAKDFGVPQNRERTIFIANKVGIDNEDVFSFIRSICDRQPARNLTEALYGLPELKAKTVKNATYLESDVWGYTVRYVPSLHSDEYIDEINNGKKTDLLLNHKARYNNARDIEIFRRLKPGDKSDDEKISDIMPYKRRADIFKDKYYKLDKNRICKTITAHMKYDCNMYIHPDQARGLTPREAARVQSYPDDYFFTGSFTKTYMQVGNSVPPLMSRIIAKAIYHFLEEADNVSL